MQTHRTYHLELRHATVPTYVISYFFPVLLVIYELYRVGYWINQHGLHFGTFNQGGFEYLLMLTLLAMQAVVAVVFVAFVWSIHHPDFGHRLTNLALGLALSCAVLVFDYFVLQVPS
jgi:histidinol phosphatase-like enzyme